MVMLELHHNHSETPETPREFLSVTNTEDNEIRVIWKDTRHNTHSRVDKLSIEEWNPRFVFQED